MQDSPQIQDKPRIQDTPGVYDSVTDNLQDKVNDRRNGQDSVRDNSIRDTPTIRDNPPIKDDPNANNKMGDSNIPKIYDNRFDRMTDGQRARDKITRSVGRGIEIIDALKKVTSAIDKATARDAQKDLVRIKNTNIYHTPNTPASPFDCNRFPNSPYCGGNPLNEKPIGLDFNYVNDPCFFGIQVSGTIGFVKTPPVQIVLKKPNFMCDDITSPEPFPEGDPPDDSSDDDDDDDDDDESSKCPQTTFIIRREKWTTTYEIPTDEEYPNKHRGFQYDFNIWDLNLHNSGKYRRVYIEDLMPYLSAYKYTSEYTAKFHNININNEGNGSWHYESNDRHYGTDCYSEYFEENKPKSGNAGFNEFVATKIYNKRGSFDIKLWVGPNCTVVSGKPGLIRRYVKNLTRKVEYNPTQVGATHYDNLADYPIFGFQKNADNPHTWDYLVGLINPRNIGNVPHLHLKQVRFCWKRTIIENM